NCGAACFTWRLRACCPNPGYAHKTKKKSAQLSARRMEPLDMLMGRIKSLAGFPGASTRSVGQTPWSARDALVPQPEHRHQLPAKPQRADGGVGRGPGVRPTRRRPFCSD